MTKRRKDLEAKRAALLARLPSRQPIPDYLGLLKRAEEGDPRSARELIRRIVGPLQSCPEIGNEGRAYLVGALRKILGREPAENAFLLVRPAHRPPSNQRRDERIFLAVQHRRDMGETNKEIFATIGKAESLSTKAIERIYYLMKRRLGN